MRCGRFQLQASPLRRSDETVFEIEFAEGEIAGGLCQLQMRVERFADRYDSVTVDWGDGTVERVSAYLAHHDYTAAGRYSVAVGGQARWFRVWDCLTSTADGRVLICRPKLRLKRWSDWLESAEGTFCGWTDPTHGGLVGRLPPWGRSIRSTRCCFERCLDIEGPFPEWTDAVTDASGTYQYVKLAGSLPAWGRNIADASFCYNGCLGATGRFPPWPRDCVRFSSCYCGCTGLRGGIPPWPVRAEELDSAYRGCTGAVGIIPQWPDGIRSASGCYRDCPNLTGAWTDDPALLMPERKVRYAPDSDYYRCYDVVTGCSEAVRSLFWDRPWGGTVPRPAGAPRIN